MSEYTIEGDDSMRWDVIYKPVLRTAEVTGARTVREVAAYLPDNYVVVDHTVLHGRLVVVIEGVDKAGWTLDDYVIPRLASGLMGCQETAS